jgi:outer membrane protein OmpA-like peptidoglycan-associated protein
MNHTSTTTRPLLRLPLRSAFSAAILLALAAGCSTIAEPNGGLERARTGFRALQGDPQVAQNAAVELTQAGEAVRTADAAWSQRDEPARVDHLAYLAQQRVAIAREVANAKMSDKLGATAKAEADADKARADADKAARDLALSRRNTQDKVVELAVVKAVAEQDKSRAGELELQLKELNAKRTERGDVITLGDVLFDTNRSELGSRSLRDMDKLVGFLKRNPNRTALIEGYTDSQGSERDNLDLSQRRAGAVRNALIDQGVMATRLTSRGYGEAHPMATNVTEAGRQANRRVEIVLSEEDGTVRSR